MSDEATVVALLEAAGLTVPPDEQSEIIAGYAELKAGLNSLYASDFADADPYVVPSVTSELSLS